MLHVSLAFSKGMYLQDSWESATGQRPDYGKDQCHV